MADDFDWKGLEDQVRHLLHELEHDGVTRMSGHNIQTAMRVVHDMTGRALGRIPKFPLYLMKAGEELQLLSLQEAGVLYDNGYMKVDFGGFVLEEGLKVREMTDQEKRQISDIADRYSESK